jgi:hypothetical protein
MPKYLIVLSSNQVRDTQYCKKVDPDPFDDEWLDIENPDVTLGIVEANSKEEALKKAYEKEELEEGSDIVLYELANEGEKLAKLREAIQQIIDYPDKDHPRRTEEGYPEEFAYEEFAYKRIVDSYRDALTRILKKFE